MDRKGFISRVSGSLLGLLGLGAASASASSNSKIVFDNSKQSVMYSDVEYLIKAVDTDGRIMFSVDHQGNLRARTKAFTIPSPDEEGMDLHHGCLEGPEHGVYIRGTGSFVGVNPDDGSSSQRVNLPDYWEALVGDDYTIMLTPTGPFDLYFLQQTKDSSGFTVISNSAKSGAEFDFAVIGKRKNADFNIKEVFTG